MVGVFMASQQPSRSSTVGERNCTWAKPGRFGSFFVLCFLALGGHCLQMLCLPGLGTHANTQNPPHFRAFPASIWEHSPPKCLFFKANAKLPNRPGFALLQRGTRSNGQNTYLLGNGHWRPNSCFLGRMEEQLQTLTLSLLLGGSSLGGPLGARWGSQMGNLGW